MSAHNAPVKNTSGDGFIFEEKVGAYFACHLLAGLPFPDPAWGTLTKLEFQIRVDGWHFDDLVTTHLRGAQCHRGGFSIKSNRQVTSQGAKVDLVKSAWAHLRSGGPTKFNLEHDRLGFIGLPHAQDVSAAMITLGRFAQEQAPADLHRRISRPRYASRAARAIYRSFRYRGRDRGAEGVAAQLLARFAFLEFDFDRLGSGRLMEALQVCRSILDESAVSRASELWERMQTIVRECRTASGYLDATKLREKLRLEFPLRGHPDYAADCSALAALSRRELDQIPDGLGGRVSLLRLKDRDRLARAAAATRTVAVVGESGSGKTTLVRHWLMGRENPARGLVWISVRELERRAGDGLEKMLGLNHPVMDVFLQVQGAEPTLVLDGVEHAFAETTYQAIGQLLAACRAGESATSWRLVFTSQLEDWDRVRQRLSRVNPQLAGAIEPVQVGTFVRDDCDPIVQVFPALSSLVMKPHLWTVLKRPKFLDLLVQQSTTRTLPRLAEWVGESDLINWWWESVVSDERPASVRETVARTVGTMTADRMAGSLPADQVMTGHGNTVTELVAARIFDYEEGRVSFAHDLYADWTRQRQLLVHRDQLAEFLVPRVELPTWRKAVRLLGLHLLEQSADTAAWKRVLQEFSGTEDNRKVLVSDLLLEAVIFAADARQLLDRLWPELIADQGRLLVRLLRAFQHVATFPHPKMVEYFRDRDAGLELEAAARLRLPFWQYWIPMLDFLGQHAAEAIVVAPEIIAEITALWLNSTEPDWPGRKAAATLAILNAHQALRKQHAEHYGTRWHAPKAVYRALLLAAHDQPAAVELLALKLSGRRALESQDIERITPAQVAAEAQRAREFKTGKRKMAPSLSFAEPDFPAQPWPDGPQRRSCREFQNAFFNDIAAEAFITQCPAATAEITLALLLEPPRSRRRHEVDRENNGFQHVEDDFPPFYTKGPFLAFLRAHPATAIATIGKLVTYATDRAQEFSAGNEENWAEVSTGGGQNTRVWRGNRQVYFWYRYASVTAHSICSALMALEKWLHERHETGDALGPWFDLILASGDSAALPGVLVGFGKKYPDILWGALWPYASAYEFHLWEAQYVPINEGAVAGGGSILASPAENEMIRQWHRMPHRMKALSLLCQETFLSKPESRRQFEEMRGRWEAQAAATPAKALAIRRSADRYRLERWTQQADGSWVYDEPEELRDDEGKRPHEERLAFMNLVSKLRKLLDRGQPLPESEAIKGWKLFEQLDRYKESPAEDGFRINKADAMTALIAVLAILTPDWLDQNPREKTTCRRRLTELVLKLSPRTSLFMRDMSDEHWDCFAAEALPTFWAEATGDRNLRECVCKLAIAGGDRSVQLLMAGAARKRAQLGPAFDDLFHLILRWAAVLPLLHRQQFNQQKTFDANAWINEWAERFVSGQMPPMPSRWTEILSATSFPPDDRGYDRRAARRHADLDLNRMTAACSWACALAVGDPKPLRAEKIGVHGQLLDALLRTFPTKPKHPVEGTPYDAERRIVKRTGVMILTMEEVENPRQFWQPLLDLGAPAHYWVESFLTHFFLTGIGVKELQVPLERIWRAMLDYAFADARWSDPSRPAGFHLDGLWEHLLGMDSIIAGAWEDEHQALLGRMAPYFQRWAGTWLGQRRGGTCFVRLLKRKAARPLLMAGLEWLLPVWQALDMTRYRDRHDEEVYADFLGHLWEKHWDEIQQHPTALRSFRELTGKLAAGQIGLALEVSARLAERP